MAITNKQLKELGFVEQNNQLFLALGEKEIIYARFMKIKDRLVVEAIDMKGSNEFIFLEHLTVTSLNLFIERTMNRIRKWKNNQDHIHFLLNNQPLQ